MAVFCLRAGRPVTKAEVVAWLEQCERLDIGGTQESRFGDPAGNVSAMNDGPSKACDELTAQAESLETLRDESKEVVTQHGDMGDAPKQLYLSGIPVKDEPLLHIEHGQSLASPAYPEQPHQDEDAREETLYPCTRCGLVFKWEENLEVHHKYCSKQWTQTPLLNDSSPIAPPGEQREASGKQEVAQPASEDSRADTGLPRSPSRASSAQHSCPECGKRFASKGFLRRHKRKHKATSQHRRSVAHAAGTSGSPVTACATKKLYKCQECGKKLAYKWQMAAHQQGHTEGKSFICHRCGESFGIKGDLRKHRRTCAARGEPKGVAEDEARLLCWCGKRLSKLHFSKHQQFHEGLRYMCLLCGKVSSFQSSAIKHRHDHVRRGQLLAAARGSLIQKVYIPLGPQLQSPGEMGQPNEGLPTGQLPFRQAAAAEGGKRRQRKWKLKPPQNTLPRPFRCRDCGKDFAYLARLLLHRKQHAGDFAFQCAECGKGFVSRNCLSLHWKIHTKESA